MEGGRERERGREGGRVRERGTDGGRERGTEGGRERGTEGGREGGRKGERERERERERAGEREGGREGEREREREGEREGGESKMILLFKLWGNSLETPNVWGLSSFHPNVSKQPPPPQCLGFCPLFTPTFVLRRAGSDVDATAAADRTRYLRKV